MTDHSDLSPEALDALCAGVVGIEPAYSWVFKGTDGLWSPIGWYTEDQARRVAGAGLPGHEFEIRRNETYPPLSTTAEGSAQLCQAALKKGIGWPVAAPNEDGSKWVGQIGAYGVPHKWRERGQRLFGHVAIEGQPGEVAADPYRAIALAVAATGEAA